VTSDEQLVERKLRQAWRRQRRYFHLRGVSRTLIWAGTLVALDFLVDWLFIFRLRGPAAWRLPLLVANAGVLLWALYYEWLRHLRRFDDVRIALQIEGRHPELASLLISYVQLKNAEQPAISPALLAAMRLHALAAIKPLDFREIVAPRQFRRPLLFAVGTILFFAAISVTWPRHVGALFLRLADREISYPTQTRIVSVTGNQTVKQGDTITLAASVAGRLPPTGELYVRPAGDQAWHSILLPAGSGSEFSHRIEELFRDTDYFFRIGDDRSAEFRITLVPPPQFVQRRVRIVHPPYTGLKDTCVDDLNVQALDGSTVSWELRCEPAVRSARMLVEGHDPVEMELDSSGSSLRYSVTLRNSLKYSFRLTDKTHGFEYDDVWHAVRVTADNVPDVTLLDPTDDGPATVRKRLRLLVRATDDYGLSKIRLVYSVNGAEDVQYPLGPLTGRQTEAAFDWTLGTTIPDLQDGDVVTVAVEACDAHEATDSRWGRSVVRRLAIVGDAGYLRWLADELDEQRADIRKAWAEEQTSLSEIQQIKGQDADFLQTRGRLLTEERRQGIVRRELSGVVRRINLLMIDLTSNDLFSEGGGERVIELNRTLAAVNTNHVPRAEDALKLARQDPVNALPHIEHADLEIGMIVRELDGLLKDMGLTLTDDVLLAQLRSIIKTEELIRRETGEWGKQLYIDPERTGLTQPKLIQAQHAVLKQMELFLQQLVAAVGQELDAARRRRFEAAVTAFRIGRPDAAMQEAARAIEASKPISGVEQQDLALKALRTAAEALAGQITDDMATVRDVMEHLRQILKAQQDLQQEVSQANAQQFQERHFQMQARQADIGKDLLQCSAQAVKTPAAFAVRKAQDAMKAAQTDFGKSRQEPAIMQQEEAIVCLMAAIEALNAIRALPPIALPEMPEYPWEVQVVSTNVTTGDIEELTDLNKVPSGKLMDMGDIIEGGGGDATQPIPSAPSSASSPPAGAASAVAGSSSDLRGKAVALSPEQIHALERRNRAAVFQNYVNRLPQEFRQQVSDYYEVLAE